MCRGVAHSGHSGDNTITELGNQVAVIKTVYLYAFDIEAQAIQACYNIDSHCGMPSFAVSCLLAQNHILL